MSNVSLFSAAYIFMARPICRRLLTHLVPLARSRTLPTAGSNIAARIAITAITVSSSISVNAAVRAREERRGDVRWCVIINGDVLLFDCLIVGARDQAATLDVHKPCGAASWQRRSRSPCDAITNNRCGCFRPSALTADTTISR